MLLRVAYYAPEEWARIASHISATTAMRNVDTGVFAERGEAVTWLLKGLDGLPEPGELAGGERRYWTRDARN